LTSAIIVVPDYSMNTLKYPMEIRLHLTPKGHKPDIQKMIRPNHPPIPTPITRARAIWEKCAKEYLRFFFQFTYAPSIHENPREDIWALCCFFSQKVIGGDKIMDRFIEDKHIEFRPKYAPGNFTEWWYEVDYKEIREELLAYLEAKHGDSKQLRTFKRQFQEIKGDNATDLDTYLKEKAKFMSELDLNGWLDDLKKEQGLKYRRNKNESR